MRHFVLAVICKRAVSPQIGQEAEYVTPAGRVLSDAEIAYALALEFDLLPNAEQRRHAG